jgi:hypothetical protein
MIRKKEVRPYEFFSYRVKFFSGTGGTGSTISINDVQLIRNTFRTTPQLTTVATIPGGTIFTFTFSNILSFLNPYDAYAVETSSLLTSSGTGPVSSEYVQTALNLTNVNVINTHIRTATGGSLNLNSNVWFTFTVKRYYGDSKYFNSMPTGTTPNPLIWSTLIF